MYHAVIKNDPVAKRVCAERYGRTDVLTDFSHLTETERIDAVERGRQADWKRPWERVKRARRLCGYYVDRFTSLDYREVKADEKCILYLDPPYRDTNFDIHYCTRKPPHRKFDHTEFDRWVQAQQVPVFMSEHKDVPYMRTVFETEKAETISQFNVTNHRREVLTWNGIVL